MRHVARVICYRLMYRLLNIKNKLVRCACLCFASYIIFIICLSVFAFTLSMFGTYPHIVWWTGDNVTFPIKRDGLYQCRDDLVCKITSDRRNIDEKVDAFLFYGDLIDYNDLPLPRSADSIVWGLYQDKPSKNNPYLSHAHILSLFNYSATFSRFSDVNLILQNLEDLDNLTRQKYFVPTSVKNELLSDHAPILYLEDDCDSMSMRDNFVTELMKYVKVDSYGACMNNKELPSNLNGSNMNDPEALRFFAKYKFTLVLESESCRDYIGKSFWRTLFVGSVPIYYGSKSIQDWLPNQRSALLINDFSRSPEKVATFVKYLLEHNEHYDVYLDHKLKHSITNKRLIVYFMMRPFVAKRESTVNEFECFVCEHLYESTTAVSVVDKSSYNCPMPVPMLKNGSENRWQDQWVRDGMLAESLYDEIMLTDHID